MTATPHAEIDLDVAQVRQLLESQHPDLAGLPLAPFDAGWDNAMWRLGDELAVRLPRRSIAAQLIENEQRWLPEIAQQLAERLTRHSDPTNLFAIPVPVRTGVAEFGFPWRWSVVPWFDGGTADQVPLADAQAPRLASFLRALHQPAALNAPVNAVRGCPLPERRAAFEARCLRVQQHTDCYGPVLGDAWQRALGTSPTTERVWLHGDLHARNVLVQAGSLRAIIDWGDMTAGDAATDLASLWMLLESKQAREAALAVYAVDDDLRARSIGWAIMFGVILLDTGLVDHPAHERMGRVTLARVTADLS